jgi:predicted amidohydrolase YtcJ
MKKMGVLADAQPQWLYKDAPALEKVFGRAGMRYFYPMRSYLDAGIVVAAGSDHMIGHDKNKAVNPYNPFLSMWIMVARKTDRGDVMVPEERITRVEALKTHTIWGAFAEFTEKSKGSIEVGKLGDVVVVDRDPLTCPEDQMKAVEPVMTVIGGKVVWEKK